MRATTIWQAYRRAHALSSLHLWDKKARRNELAFLARLEKIISEYDAMHRSIDVLRRRGGYRAVGTVGKSDALPVHDFIIPADAWDRFLIAVGKK